MNKTRVETEHECHKDSQYCITRGSCIIVEETQPIYGSYAGSNVYRTYAVCKSCAIVR